jgi:hypothetical protein
MSLNLGGNKRGNKRWYEIYIPMTDQLYEEHLKELKKEKLL